jgi:hypothetical protein
VTGSKRNAPPTPATKLYSFHITLELAAGLKVLKERDGISESEAIRRAITRFLQDREVLEAERQATPQPTTRRRRKEGR